MTKVNLTSTDLTVEQLGKLRKILPEAFAEDRIDWDKLKTILGGQIDARMEKFSFTWAGKSEAVKNVLVPSKATLIPAKDESVDFDNAENLFIEGDNLEVLKLLQKAYFEQVKMIYIDPPYNTGGDFVYHDDFKAPLKSYLAQTGQTDTEGNKLQTNTETSGRYHSDWLTMMYPRLKIAWSLLKPDGVIFISIDEHEVHHLRSICEEIFGEENYAGDIIWKNSSKNDQDYISVQHEYILCFVKDKNINKGEWTEKKEGLDEIYKAFEGFKKKFGEDWEKIHEAALEWYKQFPESNPIYDSKHYSWMDERGVYFPADISGPNFGQYRYDVIHPVTGKVCKEPASGWRYPEETMKARIKEKLVHFGKDEKTIPNNKTYLKDTEYQSLTSIKYKDGRVASNLLKKIMGGDFFTNPKDVDLIKSIIKAVGVGENEIVLDFFAGSGTTAHAVMELNELDKCNRKWICVQLPERLNPDKKDDKSAYDFLISLKKPTHIAELTKERISRVIKGYGDDPKPIDDGFKVFKLGQSNYVENQFEYDPEKSENENQTAFMEYLKKAKQSSLFPKVKDLDVVYENIVKEGLSLNSKITQTKLDKVNFYQVKDGESELVICLETKLGKDTVKLLTGKEYKDKTFICLDSALDDTAKANLSLHLELKTI